MRAMEAEREEEGIEAVGQQEGQQQLISALENTVSTHTMYCSMV